MQHQVDVMASNINDVVTCAGGWLFDQSMAGWTVTVLLPMHIHQDLRPLHILGANAVDLEATLAGPQRSPAALSVAADLYVSDKQVRRCVRAAISGGVPQVISWGPHWSMERNRRFSYLHHELSSAAVVFKSHALEAAGIEEGSVAIAETFRTGLHTRRYSTGLTLDRRSQATTATTTRLRGLRTGNQLRSVSD